MCSNWIREKLRSTPWSQYPYITSSAAEYGEKSKCIPRIDGSKYIDGSPEPYLRLEPSSVGEDEFNPDKSPGPPTPIEPMVHNARSPLPEPAPYLVKRIYPLSLVLVTTDSYKTFPRLYCQKYPPFPRKWEYACGPLMNRVGPGTEKHPLFWAFSGRFPETTAKNTPLSRVNGNTRPAPHTLESGPGTEWQSILENFWVHRLCPDQHMQNSQGTHMRAKCQILKTCR